jgi:hypothetical protein
MPVFAKTLNFVYGHVPSLSAQAFGQKRVEVPESMDKLFSQIEKEK